MKQMKRTLSLVLALVMLLSLGTTAFAGEVEEPVQAVEEVAQPVQPVEEAPAAEAPVEEAPAAETPVEEAPAAETPVEEAPVAEAPVEEAPAAEAPVEEAAAEEAAEEEETPIVGNPAYCSYPQNVNIEDPNTGLKVRVEIPAYALPEGAGLRARYVNAADYAYGAALVGENAEVKLALDISFLDFSNGRPEVIEPAEGTQIAVYVTAPELAGLTDAKVVHFSETKRGPELVDLLDVPTAENEIAFKSGEFSVYAVVGEGNTGDLARATVNFVSKGTTIATMYVKNSDTLAELQTIVYDPGTGTLASGEQFLGWTTDVAPSSSSTRMTVSQVRSYLEGLSIKEGDVVTLNAVIGKVITLTYIDENGVALGSSKVNLIGSTETTGEFTVNMAYTPPKSDQNFEGWLVNNGRDNIVTASTDEPYQNGETTLTLKGDVVLSVDAPTGHWLVFDENGKGGTYNAPQFIKSEDTTSRPRPDTEMVRFGYTFGGWFTDKACTAGNEFTFGGKLTDNTTIYAKWTPKTTAGYTVIIWKQNVNDAKNAADSAKTYDFAESISLTGTVGATINTVTAQGNGNSRYARVNGTAKQYTGFHLNKYDQNVTIATEGTSVVNVYYDRNLVTLTFVHRGTWGWVTDQTMTGLYGSKLSTNDYTWPTNRWWYDDYEQGFFGGYSGAGTRTTFLDAFILSSGGDSQTFYGFDGNGNGTVRFYKQNATGSGYPSTPNNTVNVSYGDNVTFYITDKYNGYKAVSYSKDNRNWTTLGEKDSDGVYAEVSMNTSTLYVRYDPLQYNILYMDGVYVDGNGNPVEGYSSRGQLNKVENINYDSNISSYNKGGANYYEPTYGGFVFAGWFVDDRCTQAYTFTTMPEGITVYAKWIQTQYRVFLHPNAGTDSTLDWGSEDQAMNFRISNGGKVSVPTGRRTEYEFVGWYRDEACTQAFNEDAFVLNDNTVTADYDKTVDMTDPMDKWGNGATTNSDVDRFWITKKLDLYAKWRAVLVGANGIGVVYDANGGSNAPSDTTQYLDDADAVAQSASKAPDGKVFKHWVVQKWNGSSYEDTAVTVEPGAIYKVLKANAKQEAKPDHTEEKPSYTYTVQLRAEYVNKEEPKPTHITWYSNLQDIAGVAMDKDTFKHDGISESDETGGWKVTDKTEGTLLINEAIAIRPATTYTYTGYTFLGWAKKADAKETDLFLKWDAAQGKFFAQATEGTGDWTVEVTQVAADEREYDDLYAVWKGEFYVVHSGASEENKVAVPMTATYDLTAEITEGYLYGGYYLEGGITKPETWAAYDGNNWSWTTPETEKPGTAIVPVAGETYYIKEVPAGKFLQPYTHYTYYKATGKITNLIMISDIDDLNYQQTGFVIKSENNEANICTALTVQCKAGGPTVRLTPSSLFGTKGVEDNNDYLDYLDVAKILGASGTVTMYWVTPDGLIVTGTVSRSLTGAARKVSIKSSDTFVASTIEAFTP